MIRFDPDEIAARGRDIYEAAVRLILAHGMEVAEPWSRFRALARPGVSEKDGRLFFSEDLVRSAVPFGKADRTPGKGFSFDTAEDSFQTPNEARTDDDGPRLRVGGFSLAVYDPSIRTTRPSVSADLVEALKLCRVLGIGGQYPCSATDVPPPMRNVAAHYLCFLHSDINRTHVCAGAAQADVVREMHAIAGVQMPVTMTCVTPFRVERNNLEVIRRFSERGVPPGSVRIVPTAYGLGGVSYPITLASSWALCLAEHMGLFLIASSVAAGFPIAPSVGAVGLSPVNMHNASVAAGHPNQVFYHRAGNVLAHAVLGEDWRGKPHSEYPLWTGSPVPDAQAGLEKGVAAWAGTAAGARRFGRLGNLCADDVFSCEQMLADIEILDYARRSADAFGMSGEFMDMEGLMEETAAVAAGAETFMTAPSTLSRLRRFYGPGGGLFRYDKLCSIPDPGADRTVRAMTTRKQELLRSYDREIPAEKRRALAAVYDRAMRACRS